MNTCGLLFALGQVNICKTKVGLAEKQTENKLFLSYLNTFASGSTKEAKEVNIEAVCAHLSLATQTAVIVYYSMFFNMI